MHENGNCMEIALQICGKNIMYSCKLHHWKLIYVPSFTNKLISLRTQDFIKPPLNDYNFHFVSRVFSLQATHIFGCVT